MYVRTYRYVCAFSVTTRVRWIRFDSVRFGQIATVVASRSARERPRGWIDFVYFVFSLARTRARVDRSPRFVRSRCRARAVSRAMAVTIGIFGSARDDDGFAYRARRTRAGEFYESKRVETRSEATYEAIGGDVGRRFETESANGVTTFDADSCEALDFVSMETWREDKARYEAISAMKTFGMHRLWKSFVIMAKHARVRKFRRMRRTAAEASTFFGASTSAGAVSGALDVREATAAIENEARIFRRDEREADHDDLSASTYDLDVEGRARTIAETYDADSLRAALEKQTEENRRVFRDASAHVLDAIKRAKDAVEVRFQERFDESLRPMMAATKKYKLRGSWHGARSSATKANGEDAQALRSLFPYTERALMSQVSRKMKSFERVAWMMFKTSVMNARAESLREIHFLLADDSESNDHSPPLFSVSFDFESSALDPAPARFVESFRSAANEWSASVAGESMHADAPRDVFAVDDGGFDSQVSGILRKVESVFDAALDVVNAVLSPLRAEAQSLANALSTAVAVDSAEDESIVGEFTHLAKRASLFKKECDKLATIRDGCIEVSVQTAKRSLNPIVSAPLERASERALARVADASQNLATKITKTRIECEDTGTPIPLKTMESIREDAARIDRVHADLEECGVRVPEMQTASFAALKSEIEALEHERRDDDDNDDSARV